MKILHISSAHESTGSGYAAYNLHIHLRKSGLLSDILFINSSQEKTLSYEINLYRWLKRFLVTKLDRVVLFFYRKRKNWYFSPGLFGLNFNKMISEGQYNLIHIHWVNHGFLDISQLTKIGVPIIWTMHDFWPITGGCHYFYNCRSFNESCGNCVALGSQRKRDLSSFIHNRKYEIFKKLGAKLTFVPISDWVSDTLLFSRVGKYNKISNVIYSGIDTGIFRFFDPLHSRKVLGLDESCFYVLLGATDLSNPAKGISYAIEALKCIKEKKLFDFKVLVFGMSGEAFMDSELIVNLGYIEDKGKLALIYAASNLLISPSISEAFGMVMAEAQCVGCPVVAFDSFGPRDIVNHRTTGFLSKVFDVESLVEGIEFVYSNPVDRIQVSEVSIAKFKIENSVSKYLELYKVVCES